MKTAEYIDFIITHRLPCLIWNFSDCPLEEVQNLAEQYTTENNGDIITLTRCYVGLHKQGDAYDLIPRNMMEKIEEMPVGSGFMLSIPCLPEDFDFHHQ